MSAQEGKGGRKAPKAPCPRCNEPSHVGEPSCDKARAARAPIINKNNDRSSLASIRRKLEAGGFSDKKPEAPEIPCDRCHENEVEFKLSATDLQGTLLDYEKVCRQCAVDAGFEVGARKGARS